jgi:hypothetical protein
MRQSFVHIDRYDTEMRETLAVSKYSLGVRNTKWDFSFEVLTAVTMSPTTPRNMWLPSSGLKSKPSNKAAEAD